MGNSLTIISRKEKEEL